jgi:TetR/AcrR family transcriptional repressor of nem operon
MLEHGFSAMTVERLLVRSGIGKGAFFHHFPSRADLMLALIEHHAAEARRVLHERLARAEGSSDDPLQQIIAFHHICIEFATAAEGGNGVPSANLFASVAYELDEHTPEVRGVLRGVMEYLHATLELKLRQVAVRYPPRLPVDFRGLAEHMYAVYYGGLVLGRALGDPQARLRQLRQAQDHLRLLFEPDPGATASGEKG